MKKYDHKAIEKKWQDFWSEQGVYKADSSSSLPKKYILDMFPYPSGAGLHVGHPKGYIATDILSRMYRMQGFNVLHPMGWDAFGLPAEQFAIKNKMHPSIAVDQNVATFKEQLSIIGLDYDWTRELKTTDPAYYKWTQWAFLQMFKKGLAFESHEPINWCPSCKTGLANEDLEDGKCERCGSEVEKKPLRQWVIRITDYAERMLADLDKLDKWPDSVKMSQRNWIGKSEGAEITFQITTNSLLKTQTQAQPFSKDHSSPYFISVFTTRPDTLFGVTYVVLAPESKLVFDLKDSIQNWDEVKNYIEETKKKSPLDRQKGEKTGVELQGVFAVNPANNEEVPVWIADYVLADYGTGAVMAVPAHDERDFEFAKKYNLEIRDVVIPSIIDHKNSHKENWPVVERNNIHAVVYNPKNDSYLTLAWKNHNWKTIVLGGIDEGEDLIAAAKREVLEETGYKNIEFKKYLGSPIQSLYSADHKQQNRIAYSHGLYFELINDEQEEVSSSEKDLFDIVWMDSKQFIPENITNVELSFWLDRIKNDKKPFVESGVLIDSQNFKGLTSEEAKAKITEFVGGKMKTTYKLRDWVFSRQRYWGEPIPLVHAGGKVYSIPESDLPLKLPEVENYEPSDSGESPLADILEWVNVRGYINSLGEFVVAEISPNGEDIIEGRRETNTMPQWAGSCWYYLRYIDPNNSEVLVDRNLEQYWQPVDVYVGGMEHATRHLIYARFWHKFLFDIGVVNTEEPFAELHAPGLILAEDGRKMSKRWGNVINPDDMVERFGADAFRLYEAFMGPFDDAIAWNTDGLVGTRRFVERVVRISENLVDEEKEILTRELHKLIKKVTLDIPAFKFNTAVAAMMTFVNLVEKEGGMTKQSFVDFVKILAPFAPHITEELWNDFIGQQSSIHKSVWPEFDESKMTQDEVNIAVQINGKIKGSLTVSFDASQDDVWQKVQENGSIARHITGEPKKIIFVPNKLISIVL